MVYNIFCETASWRTDGGNIPSYQTFIASWNQNSSNIKLTKAEQFSKRDVRAMAHTAINMARAKGGAEWLSDAMSHIRRSLDGDDDEVGIWLPYVYINWRYVWFSCAVRSWSPSTRVARMRRFLASRRRRSP